MKYSIEISGGFTGITKKYQGSRDFTEEQKEKIFKVLKQQGKTNTLIRDGQTYKVAFGEGAEEYAVEFSEHNLPSELRQLMDSLIHTDR